VADADGSAFVLYSAIGLVLANANSYLWNSRRTFRGEEGP
jgi:hypothetical protein